MWGEGIPPLARREHADRAVMVGIGEIGWWPDAWDWGERGWLTVGHNDMTGWVGLRVGSS
jgi:hypothetical protein